MDITTCDPVLYTTTLDASCLIMALPVEKEKEHIPCKTHVQLHRHSWLTCLVPESRIQSIIGTSFFFSRCAIASQRPEAALGHVRHCIHYALEMACLVRSWSWLRRAWPQVEPLDGPWRPGQGPFPLLCPPLFVQPAPCTDTGSCARDGRSTDLGPDLGLLPGDRQAAGRPLQCVKGCVSAVLDSTRKKMTC